MTTGLSGSARTARDREILRLIQVERRGEQEVAEEFGLSVRQVENAVRRATRALHSESRPGDRLTTYVERLTRLLEEAIEGWHRSHEPSRQLKQKWVNGVLVSETLEVKSRSGDPRWLTFAHQLTEKLAAARRLQSERGNEPVVVEGNVVSPATTTTDHQS